ncbi:MAG: hypothetical protein LBH32_01850 [Dysgonamonadaceae bacterium]|nr:hypothetical protein [Dysgonamonadaceae bacterium]
MDTDEMDNGTERSLCEGDVILARRIDSEYWTKKLNIEKWLFVLVFKNGEYIIRKIIEHDIDRMFLLCYPLNLMYDDSKIYLDEISELYNVIKIINRNTENNEQTSCDVNYTLSSSQNNELKTALSFITITEKRNSEDKLGCGGLLVVKDINNKLSAFDLMCPVEHNSSTIINVDNELKATCNKCGSTYELMNGTGTPLSGTNLSLKKYNISNS